MKAKKASEVLREYAAGKRNFRHVTLRGQSFKDKDLEGADFSATDIRGTDFTGANLTKANFTQTKCGLQQHWATGLVIVSLALSALSGFLFANAGSWIRYLLVGDLVNYVTIIPGLILIELYLIFLFIIFDKGLGKEAVVYISITIFGLTITTTKVMSSNQDFEGIWLTFALIAFTSFAVVAPLVLTIALSMSFAVGNFLAMVSALIMANFVALGEAVILGTEENIVWENLVGSVAIAIAGMLSTSYISLYALAGKEKYNIFRRIAIAFAAIGGTSFRKANLTEVDFTQATLNSTDLRGAILTRTYWHHTKKLDRVRPGASYLRNAQVRQLLITGEGQDKNFDHQDLRGVNLQGANLADASFIGADLNEANLQDADLSRAKLVQAQLDEADLTDATLTGAFIEDWGITSHTQLQGIRCRYVFMRLPTKDDPNQRRKPDNWDEEFEDGDFADFIKPIVDTLDLYHNQGVDPRAIAISFKQLAENHPEAQLRIKAMEARGEDKFLLRAETAPNSDRSALSAEYFTTYNQIKALTEAEVQALLAEKDSQISWLRNTVENMTQTTLQRPSFYTNTQVEKVGIMTNNPGGISQSNTGSMGGGQQAAIGDYNQQTMSTQAAADAGKQLSQQEVLQLLAQLEQMIGLAEIPDEIKEEAKTYLSAAKKAIEKEEPNKERAKINLEGVAEELEKATKVAEAGTTLFTKVKPILVKVAGWLGAVAAGSLLGTL